MPRAIASDPEVISNYFDMLEKVLAEYDLFDKPEQIFNINETGMPLSHRPPKIVCKKGAKNPLYVSSGQKSQITIVACTNAAGYCIPPMVIWNVKTMNANMVVGSVRGTVHAHSENGWMDKELFDIFFNNLFLRAAPSVRPLLLLMDGHSSHYCPETIRAAAKQKVILFALPPNTTHMTQPLDKGLFAPLKTKYSELSHNFMAKNPGKVVSRFSFTPLFCEAWMCSMTMKNIQKGFETTGVYPVDRNKVMPTEYQDEDVDTNSDDEGLLFIPMLIPSKKQKGYDPRRNSIDRDVDINYTYSTDKKALQDFFKVPEALHKMPKIKPKSSSRVLTSAEYMKQVEEKEIKKAQEGYRKEERKYMRELKKGISV